MKFAAMSIVFQEVPDEISLSFTISGCSLQCEGCHSKFLWNENNGMDLSEALLDNLLERYDSYISCVLFMGGEWFEEELIQFLTQCETANLKTALYTGEDDVSNEIKQHLTYLKTGRYKEELGGLSSPTTNQKFIDVKTNKILNHKFH